MNTTNKRKVLFFIPKGVGGAQKISISISKMLPAEQYEVKYILVGKRNEMDMRNLIADKTQIESITIINAWDFLTLRILRKIKEEKPDIVFSSLMYLNIRVILAAKIVGGIKVIVRNDNMLKIQRADSVFLLRHTYNKADVIIAQQDEMREELIEVLKLDRDKVVVRHNPVDREDIFRKAKEPSPYLDKATIKYIWTGNFSPTGSKGQDVLIKAFRIVKTKLPNAHLYLLGNYSEKDKYFKDITQFVTDNHLTEAVHIVGFRKNPYPWVKNADCFVLPSRIEGLPNALVDAMILSKPVVATTCIPVIGRMVKDGYNGYLVPSEGHEAMAEAMIKALTLSDFNMTYEPLTSKDFIELF